MDNRRFNQTVYGSSRHTAYIGAEAVKDHREASVPEKPIATDEEYKKYSNTIVDDATLKKMTHQSKQGSVRPISYKDVADHREASDPMKPIALDEEYEEKN